MGECFKAIEAADTPYPRWIADQRGVAHLAVLGRHIRHQLYHKQTAAWMQHEGRPRMHTPCGTQTWPSMHTACTLTL